MFKDTKAFSSFSVDDLARAKQFYGETLGLDVTDGPMGLLQLNLAGDHQTMVYPKKDHQPATFTILNFPVVDLEGAVKTLTERGVKFEHYTEGELKTDAHGISQNEGPRIAWFKDPAGNLLSVMEAPDTAVPDDAIGAGI